MTASKYLNNSIEQDHRSAGLRIGQIFRLKRFQTATVMITEIELQGRTQMRRFNPRAAPRVSLNSPSRKTDLASPSAQGQTRTLGDVVKATAAHLLPDLLSDPCQRGPRSGGAINSAVRRACVRRQLRPTGSPRHHQVLSQIPDRIRPGVCSSRVGTGDRQVAIEFKDSHFDQDVILWDVHWYVAYPISYH